MSLTTIKMETTECFWNDLFCEEELNNIRTFCDEFDSNYGSVGSFDNVDYEIRKSKISWIPRNDESDWFFHRLESVANKLNSKFFGFDINGISMLQYTIYEGDGDHYDWHCDMYLGNNLDNWFSPTQRKVSLVMQLSDPSEYEGGDLELFSNGRSSIIEKKKGLITVFPSFITHRVTPVTNGNRRTLVAWLTGPDWR